MYDNVNGTKDNPFITKTFNDVWHDINCLGTYMFAHGVKDCNVAIIGENSYEWIIAFFANLLGKIVSVPLDPKLPAEDLAVQLNEGECKAIFYSEYYAPTVEKIKEIGAPMDTYLYIPDFQKYIDEGEKLLADGYTEYKDVVVSPDDLANIVFTSGSQYGPVGHSFYLRHHRQEQGCYAHSRQPRFCCHLLLHVLPGRELRRLPAA